MTQRLSPAMDSLRTCVEEVQTRQKRLSNAPVLPPKVEFEMQDVFTVAHKTGSGQARFTPAE